MEGVPRAARDFEELWTSVIAKHFTNVSLKKMTVLTHQGMRAADSRVTRILTNLAVLLSVHFRN